MHMASSLAKGGLLQRHPPLQLLVIIFGVGILSTPWKVLDYSTTPFPVGRKI